jgi:hypothetical protein
VLMHVSYACASLFFCEFQISMPTNSSLRGKVNMALNATQGEHTVTVIVTVTVTVTVTESYRLRRTPPSTRTHDEANDSLSV